MSNLNQPSSYVHIQAPITNFLAKDPNAGPEDFNVNLNNESLNYIADRISARMTRSQSKCLNIRASKSNGVDCDEKRPLSSCSNLPDFLESESQYEQISEGEVHVIRCSTCYAYINNNPTASSSSHRKPNVPGTSLITGLTISDDDYKLYCSGGCQKWWNFKSRLLRHLNDSSQTHINAVEYAQKLIPVKARKLTVIRNQLRTAVGIVK